MTSYSWEFNMVNTETRHRTAGYAEEAFVVDVQSFLQQLMIDKGFNRAQLAEAIGVSRARISQIFSDDCKNLTIRLLARVAHALDAQPELVCALSAKAQREKWSVALDEAIESSANVRRLWEDVSNREAEADVARTHALCPDPRVSAALGAWARRSDTGVSHKSCPGKIRMFA